jgi:hypothetical protein
MLAPERFVQWMSSHRHVDRRFGHVYRYHSRSDAHSIALCTEILRDLLEACPTLRSQAKRGEIVYGINVTFASPSTGKTKTLDLALGPPAQSKHPPSDRAIGKGALADVRISCEAKSVMTEHVKSKPRVYDELSSSHEIVHQWRQDAVAAGITIVNIADTFVSPLRQHSSESLVVSQHKQPKAAEAMIEHLRGLAIRNAAGQVGFDAYATIVVDCDNRGSVTLFTAPPAPQPGDRDHYETLLDRISRFYTERFSGPEAYRRPPQ